MRFLIAFLAYATIALAQPDSLHVIWDKRGYGEGSHFGTGVFALGDQNEDGFDDWAVLSAGRATPGDVNESRLDLYHGDSLPDTISYMTFRGHLSPRRDFLEARTIGDMNGDGYVDWWTWNLVPGDSVVQVEVFFGGLAADTIPDAFFHFPATSWDWMDPAGDINGDGFDDFYLYRSSAGHDETYFFFGGSLLDTIPDIIIHSGLNGPASSLPRSFGDINGDGYGDFMTENSNSPPTTYIYLGSAIPDTNSDAVLLGFDMAISSLECDLNGDNRADLVTSCGDILNVHLGRIPFSTTPDYQLRFLGCDNGAQWMELAGDFNGDGYEDITAIDPACNLGFGVLKLYLGYQWLNSDPALTIDGGDPLLDLVGIIHAIGLGDVNGDGIQDLGIGATNEMTYHEGRRGRVVILSGDTTLHVGVDDFRPEIPRELDVTVYPNPFNAQTTIALTLPVFASAVELRVYNVLGQVMLQTTLHNVYGPMQHRLDASGFGSGLYLLRVTAGTLQVTQKIVVLK